MAERQHRAITRARRAWGVVGVVAVMAALVSISDVQPARADIASDIRSAQAQLTASRERTEAVTEQFNAAQIELRKARQHEAAAQAAVELAKATAQAARRALATYASSTYRSGGLDQFANLVSGDPQTYVDRAVALEQVTRGQRSAITSARTVAKRQADAEATAADTRKQAQAIIDKLNAQRSAIQAGMTRQQELLDTLVRRQQQIVTAARNAAERARAQALAAQLAAEARAASAANGLFGSDAAAPSVSGSGGVATALEWARHELGKPYVYGAAGPDAYDCSGLTQYVFAKGGIYLDHYTGSQWNVGRHVDRSELQPGDLVFFYSDLHHVGIYVGNGQMIDAPHSGANVRQEGVWWGDYQGAVRVTG